MPLTDAQIKGIVNPVVKKAESMIANRVAAREGSAADVKKVKAEIAKRLTA